MCHCAASKQFNIYGYKAWTIMDNIDGIESEDWQGDKMSSANEETMVKRMPGVPGS
jgi:hypothetical protein